MMVLYPEPSMSRMTRFCAVRVIERSWSGAPFPATPPTSHPAGKLAVALAVLPWKNPPVEGMVNASVQPLARGTSVGGTAGRTNAVSCTSSASRLSTTTRYEPAGTLRRDPRTGDCPPTLHTSAVDGVHIGDESPIDPVSPSPI